MTILAAPNTVTLAMTRPGLYVTVICAGATDVMQVAWSGPGGVSGLRVMRNTVAAGDEVGPFADNTIVVLTALSGLPDYDAPMPINVAANDSATSMTAAQLAGTKALVSGDGNWVTLSPSGDVTGATDFANVSQYITAAQGKNIRLSAGDWYFNDTLVRMPRRNAANTDWAYTTLLGRSTDAILPEFIGSGSSSCRLNFTNVAKPGLYTWRPPSGIANGPTLNVRSRANSSDTSNDPLTTGSGRTGGFMVIGAANPASMAGSLYDLDNESAWPNHIGIAFWGSTNKHELFDVQVRKWGTGIILHDMTALRVTDVVIKQCDIGWGFGVQTDGNIFNNCWTETCRVGHSLVWDGWQTGTGRTATFAGIGRESNGAYVTYGSSDNDCNTFNSCMWVGCSLAALAGHSNVANTQNSDAYETLFNSCYWESNGSIMYGFRNNSQGAFAFKNCNFRGLLSTDALGTYVNGGSKTGPISEILRKYIVDRFGVSQNTADANFGCFWTYGGGSAVGMLDFENCRFDASPYPVVFAPGTLKVRWAHNYSPLNGAATYPTVYAALANSQKGNRVNSATFPWNGVNSQDWGDYEIQGGFVQAAGGMPIGLTSAVALPTASSAYQGQQRLIAGGTGVADVAYTCAKSAADTWSWKTVATG